ncbi:MAG: sigma-70 family RNA polymerase sigma factor [Acidobacteriota bacterium]
MSNTTTTSTTTSPTTTELIASHHAGDPRAATELFERHRPSLRRFLNHRATSWLRGAVPLDDLVQETQLAAWHGLSRFHCEDDESFGRWLRAIARNVVNGHARRLGRAPHRLDVDAVMDQRPSDRLIHGLRWRDETPSSQLEREEELRWLADRLDRLSPRRRQALRLRHLEGLDNTSAAERMGLSVPAFKGLVARSLDELRRGLPARHRAA